MARSTVRLQALAERAKARAQWPCPRRIVRQSGQPTSHRAHDPNSGWGFRALTMELTRNSGVHCRNAARHSTLGSSIAARNAYMNRRIQARALSRATPAQRAAHHSRSCAAKARWISRRTSLRTFRVIRSPKAPCNSSRTISLTSSRNASSSSTSSSLANN